jgi:serine/threonine-protein kinase
MGTAHYIAPEQAGGGDAGPASDVYSLGVCGYECLAGRRPYLSDNAVTVAMMHIRDPLPPLPNDVPPVVRQLIEATLEKDPKKRYATGGEFAAAVAAVRRGDPLPLPGAMTEAMNPATRVAPAPSPPRGNDRPERWAPEPEQPRKSGPWAAIAGIAAVLAVLAILGYLLIGNTETSPPTPAAAPVTTTTTRTTTEPTTTTTRSSRTTTSTSSSGATVTINPASYIGRSAREASTNLQDLGLQPEVLTLLGGTPDDETTCRVVTVSPVGQVSRGDPVTLRCTEFGG